MVTNHKQVLKLLRFLICAKKVLEVLEEVLMTLHRERQQ